MLPLIGDVIFHCYGARAVGDYHQSFVDEVGGCARSCVCVWLAAGSASQLLVACVPLPQKSRDKYAAEFTKRHFEHAKQHPGFTRSLLDTMRRLPMRDRRATFRVVGQHPRPVKVITCW